MMFYRRLLRLCWIFVALITLAGTAYAQSGPPISLFPAPPPGPPVPLQDGSLNQPYSGGGIFENNFVGPTTWSIVAGGAPPRPPPTPRRAPAHFHRAPPP